MRDLLRLLGYVQRHSGRFAAAVASSAMVALFTLALPLLVRPLIDNELKGAVPVPWSLAQGLPRIEHLGGPLLYTLIVVAFFGKGLFSYLSQYLMSWVGERAVMNLRADLGRAIARQSAGFFTRQDTGSLISRMTSDADRVLVALSDKLYDSIKEPLSLVALIGLLLYIQWPLALISLVLAPAVVVPVVRFGQRLRRASERSQERVGDLATRVDEVVRGNRLIQVSSTQDEEGAAIARAARGVFAANMRGQRVSALSSPILEFLGGTGIALAFFYGRTLIARGLLSEGEFVSFFTALALLYQPAKKLSRVQAAFEQARAAARRCFEIIDAEPAVRDAPGAAVLGPVKGEVRFEGVSFAYGDREVLRDLDLLLPAGAVTALVGRSGGGKTTIANLILRLFEPSAGRITIDGRDLGSVTLESLRRQIGVVAQDVFLFNNTLAANIAYGLAAVPRSRLEDAARAAHAHDFITALPEGYDTVVGEAGIRLSTGQRQRIAIARALLKDPPLLILDEATSALDAESEQAVVSALQALMRGRTTLVIAHRLATVRRADIIHVLEGGRLLESGTHEELVRREGGLYNRLAELQALGEISE